MVKQSVFSKKMNLCVSRIIIASALAFIAILYVLVANNYIKAPHFGITSLRAEAPQKQGTAFINVKDTQELMALFETHEYSLDVSAVALEIPSLCLEALPSDFAKDLTIAEKKELFMKTLLPLILEANAEIVQERQILLPLVKAIQEGRDIVESQKDWLKNLADKYRVRRFSYDKLDTLVARVDVIPVAMALGQAIEEAGWGRSYAARNKNATHGVTLPSGVLAYESLMVSVKSYMRNLNANPAYIKMRKIRSDLRAQKADLCGVKMMDGLYYYSELHHNYISKVKKHIHYNNLTRFDEATLKDV